MANVNVKFNNKDYLLSCDDGQEESLKKLTKFLDKKYSELREKLGNIGENKLLLITTIQLIDEYFDLKQKVTNQKIKLDEISAKFKEIRALAIEYKKNKDIEIQKLNEELARLREQGIKAEIDEERNVISIIIIPLFIFTINFLQIIPEEEALKDIYGPRYDEYLSKVRRWF